MANQVGVANKAVEENGSASTCHPFEFSPPPPSPVPSMDLLPISDHEPCFDSTPFQTALATSNDYDNGGDKNRPSNTQLLCIAFASFTTFASVQLFFAFLADSEAMKGDSAAMIVDSMTYLFNFYAEKRKARFDQEYTVDSQLNASIDPEMQRLIKARERRKLVLRLEIIPPLISVTTLIAVTVVVLRQAIKVLRLDIKRSEADQSHPNVRLMMIFSIINLVLDFVNVFYFAKANHLQGFETRPYRTMDAHNPSETLESSSSSQQSASEQNGTCHLNVQEQQISMEQQVNGKSAVAKSDDPFEDEAVGMVDSDERANLNMVRCSIWERLETCLATLLLSHRLPPWIKRFCSAQPTLTSWPILYEVSQL